MSVTTKVIPTQEGGKVTVATFDPDRHKPVRGLRQVTAEQIGMPPDWATTGSIISHTDFVSLEGDFLVTYHRAPVRIEPGDIPGEAEFFVDLALPVLATWERVDA